MPENHVQIGSDPQSGGGDRVPRRAWIVWVAVFGGIILLMLFKDRMQAPGEILTQYKFEQLVDAGEIVHATINYDQSSGLNEVVGSYYRADNGAKIEVPFRAKVRLAGGLERKLLSLPQFEPHEPNTMLVSLLFSVLPILLVAVLIWFFFIRQIRKAARSSPTNAELQIRAAKQQDRQDKILDKWEEQLKRMDAVLDKLDKDRRANR